MICPYCGEKMEHGYIQSGDCFDVFFTKKKSKLASALGITQLTTGNTLGVFVEAYKCEACKKIVIDYSEKRAQMEETKIITDNGERY